LFQAIDEFVVDTSTFYAITKTSWNDLLNAIKQNPNFTCTTLKDNVEYKTLKKLKNKSNGA
jgi:hypothetical protein